MGAATPSLAVGELGGNNRGEELPRRHPDQSALCWPMGSSACQDREGGSLLSGKSKRSRVRPMIGLALGEKAKLRIAVRSLSVLLRAGATGFDTALATSGLPQISIMVSWSSIGSNSGALPNSTPQSRVNQVPRIISLISSPHKLKRWRNASERIDIFSG